MLKKHVELCAHFGITQNEKESDFSFRKRACIEFCFGNENGLSKDVMAGFEILYKKERWSEIHLKERMELYLAIKNALNREVVEELFETLEDPTLPQREQTVPVEKTVISFKTQENVAHVHTPFANFFSKKND